MILTPKMLLRVAALLLAAVLLQVSFFSRVTVIGASPDVAVLAVIVLGLLGGVMIGAVCGFGAGLLVDSLIVAPLGSAALAYFVAGYLAGLYRERSRRPAGRLAIPVVCMALTLASEAVLLLVHATLGLPGPIGFGAFVDVTLRGLYAFALALPVHLGARRLLRPSLVEEAPFERGSAPDSRPPVLET